MTSAKFSAFLTPSFPCPHLDWVWNSRNLPHYVRFSMTPLPFRCGHHFWKLLYERPASTNAPFMNGARAKSTFRWRAIHPSIPPHSARFILALLRPLPISNASYQFHELSLAPSWTLEGSTTRGTDRRQRVRNSVTQVLARGHEVARQGGFQIWCPHQRGRASWKSRRSEGGWVHFIVEISSICRQRGGRNILNFGGHH